MKQTKLEELKSIADSILYRDSSIQMKHPAVTKQERECYNLGIMDLVEEIRKSTLPLN